MITRPERIIAIVEPLPAGETMARRILGLLRETPVRELLWVTLTGPLGLEFDCGQLPLTTPSEWLHQTQESLQCRWHDLSRRIEMPRWRFMLVPGAVNPALAELSATWSADRIMLSQADWPVVSGQDAPAWLFPPRALTGTPHLLPNPPGLLARSLADLRALVSQSW
ncbi:hypothetical protein SIID45300_03005 [Candidatus Magnetaquicoccaceae bacterium FCR-1]|uniref:Uncharacterized protein n=1 Tax=Candidatus Magnetaquiglobus chichijimensis TaxID=3141448 RepID=A0ABQ0CCN7_9PROT